MRNGSLRIVRWAALIVAGLFAAFLSIRSAVFASPGAHPLATARTLFPNHPSELKARLELDAANAAMAGGALSEEAQRDSMALLKAEPLAALPLLLAGGSAQLEGNQVLARQAYLTARKRDPRNPAARFLLAESLLRFGDVEGGLEEMLGLTRVARQANGVAGAVAEFAKQPGNQDPIRRVFARDPALQAQVLNVLAADPKNVPLVLSLARPLPQDRAWEATMLDALINAGEVQKAHALWDNLGKMRHQAALNPGDFRRAEFVPPFDWQFPQSDAGIAEVDPRSGLKVLFYGRNEGVFAKRLIAVRPGNYSLATTTTGAPTPDIRWKLQCLGGKQILETTIFKPSRFTVPADCTGAWLSLVGTPNDTGATAEFAIQKVAVTWTGN